MTVQLLYTSPPAESWSKGSLEHVPCCSILPAAAPAVSMMPSGQKGVGMAILHRQVFSAQNRHLVVCVGSRELYPAPRLFDPGYEYIGLQELGGLRWQPRGAGLSLGWTRRLIITSGEPRLLPRFPAQPGGLLAFLSQGHACIGLGLKSENPSVTVTMDYYYITPMQCGFG